MAKAVLTISSKNYGAWALRGWLMTKLAGLAFTEKVISPDDPDMKAEMLLLSASMRVPALDHDGLYVWDTLAIGEYLNEIKPNAGLLPADRAARAHCRAICGEMHSGFSALRSSLPMNIKAHSRASSCGRARRPTSTASPPSGQNACSVMVALTCSVPSPASPTPCLRRW